MYHVKWHLQISHVSSEPATPNITVFLRYSLYESNRLSFYWPPDSSVVRAYVSSAVG